MTDPPDPDNTSAASPQRATGRRRWWRWLLAGVALVLAVLVIFHRPVLRFVIDFAARKAAAAQKMSLTWNLSGSVTGNLTIDDAAITGGDGAPVRLLNLAHAELQYDPWQWRTYGPGGILKSIVVHGLNAELDLTARPRREPAPKTDHRRSTPPAIRLPEIDLRDVHLTIRQAGGTIVVRGFRFLLDADSSGVLEADRIEIPGVEPLVDVRGTTTMTPQSLAFADLTLWAGVEIRNLALDLSRLPDSAVPVVLSARQGDAIVDIDATASETEGELVVNGSLSASSVSAAHLQRWGVPDGGTAWHADRLALTVSGPVLRPDRLEANLNLTAGRFLTGPVQWDGGELRAAMGNGRLEMTGLDALAGPNSVSASGSIDLPERWAGMARMNAAARWTLSAPEAERLVPPDVDVAGSISGAGNLGLTDGRISRLSAQLDGRQLEVSGVPAEAVSARLAGDLTRLQAEEVRVQFDSGNIVTASGAFEPGGDQAFEVRWNAQCGDLATIPAAVRAETGFWPSAGTVLSTGEISGSVMAIRTGQWEPVTGNVRLEAAGLRIEDAALQSVRLEASASGGDVRISTLAVHLDERNSVQAAGSVRLPGEGNFNLGVTIELPELAALSPWSGLAGGPRINSGQASVSWTGAGTWRDGSIEGDGSLRIAEVHVEGMPGPLAAAALVRHRGTTIDLPEWNASSGQWRAAGSMTWTGSRLEIPAMEAFAGSRKLLNARVSLPLSPGGSGGPVDPDEPVEADVKADRLELGGLATALGQTWPVTGTIAGSLTATGTLRTLEAKLQVDAGSLRVTHDGSPDLEPATLQLEAALANGTIALNGSLHQRPLQPLTVSGTVPFSAAAMAEDVRWMEGKPVDVRVSLPPSRLSFLPSMIPDLATVDGTASLNANVTGTLSKPEWRGEVRADVPSLALDRASLPSVKDLKLRIAADGYRVSVEQAEVIVAGGKLQLTGGSDLTNVSDPSLDLRLRADQVLTVRDEAVSLRANGDLICQGTLSRSTVRGSVELVRGRIFKEIEYLPLSLPNQLPPPPPPVHAAREGPPTLPPPLDQWTFDVTIRTRDPVRLMGNVARGDATADLRIGGTGAGPELTGSIDLSDIWVKLPYSRVTFPEATVTFTRDAPFDPRIDIRGESLVGDRQVYINVQGRALDPLVRFSSSPPLPEGEIATLLATGVTTEDLQGSGDVAAGRAAFLLLSDLYRKLFRKEDRPGDDDEPPRLTFDFSLVGSGRTGRNVSAIYELSPRWRAIGRVSETGTFRGLLYYLIRFR